MIYIESLCAIFDLGILIFVYLEYRESRETNRSLLKLLSKQRGQKQKVSVDRVIKAALQKGE